MLFRVMKPFILLALLVTLIGTACLSSGGETPEAKPSNQEEPMEPETPSKPSSSSKSAVNNIDDVQGAVFQIIGTGTINTVEDGEILNAEWGGTGFFIDSSGIGVTNNHVVAGAALLKAYVNGETKARNVTILGTSECADLAVVQVQGDDFPYLEWFEGSVKTGLDVYAAGFPLVEPEYNLTKGIISKVNAEGETYWASLDYIYGHDAKINGGNSGGPLVTEEGQVVGVNYMSRASVDQQFAIPGELAVPIVSDLQEEQNVASVGLAGSAVVFGPASEYPGIWVESTTTGGVADKAGILPGDIIHEVETILIATDGTMKDYCDILKGHKENDELKVMVYRAATDEILEGSLNGDKLETIGIAGLSGSLSNDENNTNNTTGGSTSISTEFDTDPFNEGWYTFFIPESSAEDSIIRQKPGRLYFNYNESGTYGYVINDSIWGSDQYVAMTATKVKGPNRFNFGLACRVSDQGWYEFNITTGGYWNVLKVDYNASKLFTTIDNGGSKFIRVQGATNFIEATCIGNTLTFYINGEKVTQVEDRDIVEGSVGFNVSSLDLKGIEVEVENFAAELIQ